MALNEAGQNLLEALKSNPTIRLTGDNSYLDWTTDKFSVEFTAPMDTSGIISNELIAFFDSISRFLDDSWLAQAPGASTSSFSINHYGDERCWMELNLEPNQEASMQVAQAQITEVVALAKEHYAALDAKGSETAPANEKSPADKGEDPPNPLEKHGNNEERKGGGSGLPPGEKQFHR